MQDIVDYTDEDFFSILPQVDEIKEGLVFASMEAADVALRLYAQQHGFAFRSQAVKKDKNNIINYKAFYCTQAGSYKPRKVEDTSKQRNRTSGRIGCKFHINLSRRMGESSVVVTTFNSNHNHEILPDTARFHMQYCKLSKDVQEAIATYTRVGGINARVQGLLIQEQFEQQYSSESIHRAVQRAKKQTWQPNGEAAQLIKTLMKRKQDNPEMVFDYDHNEHCQLTRVFWMDYEQVLLYL